MGELLFVFGDVTIFIYNQLVRDARPAAGAPCPSADHLPDFAYARSKLQF